MSLLERVLEAAGETRWARLGHFTSHLMLDGSLVEPLERAYSLKEIVAEGDLANRSIRMSGFSEAGAAWGFYPDFITIQDNGGVFVGTRREIAPRPYRHPADTAERVYLCGLGIWSCMTPPSTLLRDVQSEELGAWSEHGQTWWRLKVRTPEGALAFARDTVMYFDDAGLLRRTDFDILCGETLPLAAYWSAHQSFSGLMVPTLLRIVNRPASADVVGRRPVLDIEIFDVIFS